MRVLPEYLRYVLAGDRPDSASLSVLVRLVGSILLHEVFEGAPDLLSVAEVEGTCGTAWRLLHSGGASWLLKVADADRLASF